VPIPPDPHRRDLRRYDRRRRARTVRRRRVAETLTVLAALVVVAAAVPTVLDRFGVDAPGSAVTRLGAAGEPLRLDDLLGDRDPASRSASRGEAPGTAAPTAPQAPATSAAPPEPSPSTGPTAPSAPAADADGASGTALADEIVELTNAARADAGLDALVVSACATEQALGRTQVLVAEGRFEHDPLEPVVAACGGGAVGENLAQGYPSARATVDAWLASPGHRDNLLRASYASIGVACTASADGPLCAQVFLG